jgi:predicted nuclease of predicted toxin-antitoxin system
VRIFVDQMIRQEVATSLRDNGHDVLRALDVGLQRADDAVLLDHTCREGRVLLTLDGHFGNWAVLPLNRHPGVIRLKVHPPTVQAIETLLIPFLAKHDQLQFENTLIILSQRRARWVKTSSD